MSERFGPGAQRLAGWAARQLGWRPAEFWAATPAELAAVLAAMHADGPGCGTPATPLNRADLSRMMEHDHD